jgi:hypothetical protein
MVHGKRKGRRGESVKADCFCLSAPACIRSFLLLALLFLLPVSRSVAQTGTTVDQKMIRVATISDPKLIEFFLFEFLITDTAVTKMEIIDATSNGFGIEDLVKCYPSERIYVPTPSDTAQKIMNAWQFTANFQIVTQNSLPDIFEGTQTDAAQNGILAALLRGLHRNYKDLPMKIYFERDNQTATFEMWGYNSSRLTYNAPPPTVSGMPDTITAFDVLSVTYKDTLVVADTTIYDLLYILRTVSDTVYVGVEGKQPNDPGAAPKPESQSQTKPGNGAAIRQRP